MKSNKLWLSLVLGIGAVCSLAGCGGGDKPLPKEYGARLPVQGKVLLGGKPLRGGNIQFYALDHDVKTLQPMGLIDAEGNYFVSCYGEKGAPSGKYRVTVDPGSEDKSQDRLVGARYRNWEKSPLVVTVRENAPPDAYDLKLEITR